SQEATHDVLRRIGAVDADDQVLRAPVPQLSLLDHDAMRVSEARRRSDIDRDGVVARIDHPTVDQHRALALVDRKTRVFFASHQEVTYVEAGLKADDVAAKQPIEDRVAHLARKDL